MAEYKFDKQTNYGFPFTFAATDKFPLIAKRIFETYADAKAFIDDVYDTAVAGLVLSVINDTDKLNGLYRVVSVATGEGKNDGVLEKVGSNVEALSAETYAEALKLATAENLTRIIDVKNSTPAVVRLYQEATEKDGEGTIKVIDVESSSTEGAAYTLTILDPNDETKEATVLYYPTTKVFDYNGVTYTFDTESEYKSQTLEEEKTAGLYIVNGVGSVAKLGTTTASGDLEGAVTTLQGKVSTIENNLSALSASTVEISGSVSGLTERVVALETTKEYFVESGSVEEISGETYIVLKIKNLEEPVMVKASDLVDVYTSGDDYIVVDDHKIKLDVDKLKEALDYDKLATKDDIDALSGDIKTITDKIDDEVIPSVNELEETVEGLNGDNLEVGKDIVVDGEKVAESGDTINSVLANIYEALSGVKKEAEESKLEAGDYVEISANTVSVKVSEDEGNILRAGTDGGLFAGIYYECLDEDDLEKTE